MTSRDEVVKAIKETGFITLDYMIGATYEKDGQYIVDRKKLKEKGWTTIYTGSKEGCITAVNRDAAKISKAKNVNVISKISEV